MRQLRLVRLAEQTGDLVLESADGLDQFALTVDESVRAAVRPRSAALTPPPAPPVQASPPASAAPAVEFGPRDIQVRIRAGESPQELADSLGVPLDRVMRFAGPVMDERIRITDEARRARAHRTGSETLVVQFGEAVDDRFAAHGIDAAEVGWDSHRRDGGDWVVTAEWAGGEGRHSAQWLFHRGTRSVTALDDTANDLLSDRPIRPVAPTKPERPALSAAPPLAPGVVAFPPMPDALTGPLPRYQEVFDQDAPADGPRELPPFVPSADDPSEFRFEEPPLPLGITDPSTRPGGSPLAPTNINRKRDETEDDKASRARVPSWDDILLGVRRKD